MRVHKALSHLFQLGCGEGYCSTFHKEASPTKGDTAITEEGEVRRENVLVEEAARLEIRKNFFNVRAAKTWNGIPDKVRNQSSINAFKTAYDNWKRNGTIPSLTSGAPEAPLTVP